MAVFDLLAYDFARSALAAGLLSSVLCGLVGSLVVVKRLVFAGGGISHATFGGLGIAYFFGVDPRIGAVGAAVAAALGLGWTTTGRSRRHDAGIGVLWAVGMAVGMVFIASTPGYAPDLVGYLFGNILAVRGSDVVWLALLVVASVCLMAAFSKEVFAAVFDEAFASVQGVSVRFVTTALMVVVALSVVLLVQVVGVVLVIAQLTIPPLVALRLVHGMGRVMTLATAVGAVMTTGGLFVSFATGLPSGPVIVLVGAALLATVHLARSPGQTV